MSSHLSIDTQYQETLHFIKETIYASRIKSILAVNQELLIAYWKIWSVLSEKQKNQWWGSKVIDTIAKDIKHSFPHMTWFSRSNLMYMQQFANLYTYDQIVQAPLGQITWYHHITLFQKCKDESQRMRYAYQIIEHGRSRNMLVHHIDYQTYQRSWKAITNFTQTLPTPQSDFAQQMTKDPYIFDFLSLTDNYKEKELEDQLTKHITHFLLELWSWFAFVGRQYALTIDNETYYIDMLFYHIYLQCYIVIELKIGDFEPEFVGKMNFYINAVDTLLKKPSEHKTIGIILCKNNNTVKAQYALQWITSPIGISQYELEKILWIEFISSLPTIQELEQTLQVL